MNIEFLVQTYFINEILPSTKTIEKLKDFLIFFLYVFKIIFFVGPSSSGAPNRPLPPTPDEEESGGDRTLVMRKVSKNIEQYMGDGEVLANGY